MNYKDKFLLEEKQLEELLGKHVFNKNLYPVDKVRIAKHNRAIEELKEKFGKILDNAKKVS